MSKTNIEYVDETWHVVTGCKGPDSKGPCEYCYVKRFVDNMTPRFNPGSVSYPYNVKTPSRFLVGNMGDLWGEWTDRKDILRVLGTTRRLPQHTFLFLTKNPKRYLEFEFTDNCWLGTSVDSQSAVWRIDILASLKKVATKWVSVEPILSEIRHPFLGIQWVVIGAETTRSGFIPKDADVSRKFADPLIANLRSKNMPIFIKDNMQYDTQVRQFPEIAHKYQQETLL